MASTIIQEVLFGTSRGLYSVHPYQNTLRRLRASRKISSNSQHARKHSTASIPVETRNTKQPDSPLSALSTKALLRSLFINSISSKSWLLSPSICFMSMLCNPGRSAIFDVDRNRVLAWIVKDTIYKQFCAGETAEEVRATMKTMRNMGLRGTILTYAQETVFDHHTNSALGMGLGPTTEGDSSRCHIIQTWRDGTLKTVEMLGEGDQLAIKMTGAGPSVTKALSAGELPPPQMLDALDEISKRCKKQKARMLIDAESQHYQAGIHRVGLDLIRKYNKDGYAVIYNTYQAYLKSTPSTLSEHLTAANKEDFTLGMKLVRGAYLTSDPRNLIHDTKQETDDTYNSIAQGILRRQLGSFGAEDGATFPSVNLVLAGHNRKSVFDAYEVYQQRLRDGLPTVPVGFAQLHGMSDEISLGLLQFKGGDSAGPEVYKCSTWGSLAECLGYLTRRATENREAASRTADGYAALKAEAWRRFTSAFSRSSPRQ